MKILDCLNCADNLHINVAVVLKEQRLVVWDHHVTAELDIVSKHMTAIIWPIRIRHVVKHYVKRMHGIRTFKPWSAQGNANTIKQLALPTKCIHNVLLHTNKANMCLLKHNFMHGDAATLSNIAILSDCGHREKHTCCTSHHQQQKCINFASNRRRALNMCKLSCLVADVAQELKQ